MTIISRSIPQSPTKSSSIGGWRGLIEEYRQFLPVSSKTPVITLLEGNTPL
ncbi:MAG: threonine synthase, partial [Microcystis sp. M49637_WE12]|nr:threonine synthase [Microcystis sp. M49637_WE12]MDJ0586964.1 threonine synthase [Microcystis sp. M49636_WE2]